MVLHSPSMVRLPALRSSALRASAYWPMSAPKIDLPVGHQAHEPVLLLKL